MEEDRRANKDIESWLKTTRGDVIARILLAKYLTFEAIHHFANEQRSVLLSHPFFFWNNFSNDHSYLILNTIQNDSSPLSSHFR